MRRIKRGVVHCSATPPDMDIGAAQIRAWHVAPKSKGGRGWLDIGYHDVIKRDGTIERGRAYAVVGAHVAGFNADSIGVCMVGGVRRSNGKLVTENNFTPQQFASLLQYMRDREHDFPGITWHGHRDFDKHKDCPSFSVRDLLIANGWERPWL